MSYGRFHRPKPQNPLESENLIPSNCAGRPLLNENEPDLCGVQACSSYVELGRTVWLHRFWPGVHYSPAYSALWSLDNTWTWQTGYTVGLDDPSKTDLKNFITYMNTNSEWSTGSAPGFGATFDGIPLHYYVDPWNLCPWIENHTGNDFCYDPLSTGQQLVLRASSGWMFHAVRYEEMLDLAEQNGNLDILISEYSPTAITRQDHIDNMACASGGTVDDGIPAQCIADSLESLRATIQYYGDQSPSTLRSMLWFPEGGPHSEISWKYAHLFNSSTYTLTSPVGSDWKADALANP